MQPSDVTMYGRDYSAREFSDHEFRQYMAAFPGEKRVDFLGRYIGYPTNRKCVSHYPGMYRHHLDHGRPSFLFHQIGYTDMAGGFDGGRAHAQIALADARSSRVGWDGESHIIACMDRFYAKAGYATLTRAQLREYMSGFRSVLGDRTGFYGFFDSMAHAVAEDWASFYVQCGARSAHVSGIHAWQENNYQPRILDTLTDILELYCDPTYAFGGSTVSKQDVFDAWSDMAENPEHPAAEHARQVLTQYKMPKVVPDGADPETTTIHDETRWASENFRQARETPAPVVMTPEQLAALGAQVREGIMTELGPLFELAERLKD